MSEVAVRQTAPMLGDVTVMVAEIRNMTDPLMLKDTLSRVKAARVWAEAEQQIAAIRHDLIVIEIEALRRLYELGQLSILSGNKRTAATWFGKSRVSADELVNLAHEQGRASTADSVHTFHRWVERCDQMSKGLIKGRRRAEPEDVEWQSRRYLRERLQDLVADVHDAVEEGQSFTVADLVDAALAPWEPEETLVREAVLSVCKKAVQSETTGRSETTVLIDGVEFPTHLMVPTDERTYLRVPVESAVLDDFENAVAFRRAQVADAQAALEHMEEVLSVARDRFQRLGKLK